MALKCKRTMIPILVFITLLSSTHSLPQGAPKSACQSMMPSHGGGIASQTGIPPYSVVPRRQGGSVLVTITSALGIPFQGFMLQARTPNSDLLGEFDLTATPDAHTVDCAEVGDTITHRDTSRKESIDVTWRPPRGYEGQIIFNATVAQDYSNFWVGVESPPVDINKRDVNDPPPSIFNSRPAPTTRPNFTPEVIKESSTDFDPFYDRCNTEKLCFGAPSGCVASKNCKAVVAVTVRGDIYEFEMKATNNAAYVATGLSDDDKMGDDSVLECVKKDNSVEAYMSWTEGHDYAARLPNPQLGIRLLNRSIVDDTIYCKVQRDAVTTVRGKTFNLINDAYYLLSVAGSRASASGVSFHDIGYVASGAPQKLSDVSSVGAASKLLLRLHGSFMLAAWIGTASVGVLLARYYRQTWVGSQLCGKDQWFAWHRMFMVLTWALTMTGFILIFVELKDWSSEKNPHAILGTITTVLCFIQPIGAYFRPHPGTPKRPIFNWMHWLIGNTAHIIAIVTIFFAVKLNKAELPDFVDWILVAYVAFHVLSHLVLSVLGCISEKSSEKRVSSFPMKDLGGSGRSSAYADRNGDAPYSTFRKVILAIYILIVLALVVALIAITALAPIEDTWNNFRSRMSSSK